MGGGIAGLAAAWELTGGAEGPRPDTPAVVLLEASARLGGKLRTEQFHGLALDVGPDGFLGRRPEGAAICREVGLGDDLVPIGASGATVWIGGRRRPLPEGLVLGVPTRLLPAARSGVLGLGGTLRLLADLVVPRPDRRGPLGDRAVGPLVSRKLGRRVVDRLVDPLLGGIYAGGVSDASAAAVFPLLLAVSQRRASFMRSLRRAAAPGAETGRDGDEAPAFWSLRGGLQRLADRLEARLVDRGAVVRRGAAVVGLEPGGGTGSPWIVRTDGGSLVADGVVLAVPAGPAAGLLASHDPDGAARLRAIDYSSVAVVTLSFPAPPGPMAPGDLDGTGLLVPRGTPLPSSVAERFAHSGPTRTPAARRRKTRPTDGSFMVSACTYLSAKWPHLARPGELLVRASVGRMGDERFTLIDDERLVERVAAELEVLVGTPPSPSAWRVDRWRDALPQYRVHHLLRVAAVEAAARRLPALSVAGAAYRGVGIPACVAGGRAAAREVLDRLDDLPKPVPSGGS